ncbi:MAG: 3-phosphoshikimate 1-carboxyvinyltransferase [Planctomycetes bacterium]|nr:3-phosphoshikimate 1-carboxyvinyltransferase [Planctomycetota bacterium]
MADTMKIEPRSGIDACVRVPGSKSITNRAMVLAGLAEGETVLDGALSADDTGRMLGALAALGFAVAVDDTGERIAIIGEGGRIPAKECDIYAHQAGTVMRFMTAVAALGEGPYRLDGDSRMRQRPIGALADALIRLGAEIAYEGRDGYPPLMVRGPAAGGRVELDASISSQFVSALLLMGPALKGGLGVTLKGGVTSRPFIDMTLAMMRSFGADASWGSGDEIGVREGSYDVPSGGEYRVEGDATAASYFWAAALITGGSVRVENVHAGGLQGDTAFVEVLGEMGASVKADGVGGITVSAGRDFKGVEADMNAIPDCVQTLAVTALFAEGPTRVENVGNLRVKETDRLAALETELAKLGARVTAGADWIEIDPGEGPLHGAVLSTYGDHRMAMSLSLAGLRIPGVEIENPECVGKTFPGFFDVLGRL